MCPPAAAPPRDLNYNCTVEELIMHLEKLQHGSPLPRNVIIDVNPYCRRPENLPDKMWYFIHSEYNKATEVGVWKPKGEPSRVFSNTSISGWRTTLEFFEGQTPHSPKKTNWIMQEFKVTPNKIEHSFDGSRVHEPSMLCKVFHSAEDLCDPELEPRIGGNDSLYEKSLNPIPLLLSTDSRFEKGSTSNHEENDQSDKVIAEIPPNDPVAENLSDDDCISRGDYIELWDLETRGSPSSSSDNSSCVTMSSDECFDSLALLQDLEPAKDPNLEGRDISNCHPNTSASDRPDVAVRGTAASGSLIINEPRNLPDQETRRTDLPSPTLAKGREKKRECSHENPSPNSCEATPSTSRQSSDSEGSKKGNGRIKRPKKKYLCFLPFQFFF
ncbi:protein NTM1-like 9 [Punica granatum]|uniref:NAC domain-containing protein n=2 Tax=Punica granatum TaxID=22663 RepID=A0A218X8I3_PUNGR|nr:protein NTM1-like 9 [Punica granatum]OWM80821.1 hypothetical protein CDL15_Pgr006852 [Punica granatum]PKI43748.1 hypothetical protein CRG98_035854 [Punica granatum]